MTVTPIPGEATRFETVSSNTLRCAKCHREFRKNAGKTCPKCHLPAEFATYLQDVASFWGHGQCSCPRYRINIQPSYERRDFSAPPCRHLLTAFMLFGQAQARKLGEPIPRI